MESYGASKLFTFNFSLHRLAIEALDSRSFYILYVSQVQPDLEKRLGGT